MSDLYSLYYTQNADNDLSEIYSYIAYHIKEPDIALKQINRIRSRIRSLNQMPYRYPPITLKATNINVHRATIDNYLIYYNVNEEKQLVTILRIVYKGRNLRDIRNSNN